MALTPNAKHFNDVRENKKGVEAAGDGALPISSSYPSPQSTYANWVKAGDVLEETGPGGNKETAAWKSSTI